MGRITNHPALPDDPRVMQYVKIGCLHPTVFSNWREECRSWKESAYLSANISTEMPMLTVRGKDATKLLSENCVNNIEGMKVGTAKHAILCSKNGNIVADGMLLKLGEDSYGCYALQPLIMHLANCGRYDVEPIEYREDDFIFQVAGPKSLEILEQTCEEELRDIGFMRFRTAKICGCKVRVIRMGMAGTLGYEVQGPIEHAHSIYNRIYECGLPYGIKKLGYTSYSYDHAENGFPQGGIHFMFAWKEHDELWNQMSSVQTGGAMGPDALPVNGSMVEEGRDNLTDCYRNPIELGWGKQINWDHEFVGKKALAKLRDGRHRETATLAWNVEDVMDIQASFYGEEEPYKEIVYPLSFPLDGLCGSQQNKVLDEKGNLVGKASFPEYSISYRKLFSLAVIDSEVNVQGKELALIWGGPGDRKKKVRVTVDRYPLLDQMRNEHDSLEDKPHLNNKSKER